MVLVWEGEVPRDGVTEGKQDEARGTQYRWALLVGDDTM